MYKRLLTLIIISVFLGVGFAGCGRVAGAENEPEPDPEPIQQTYVVDGITVTASPENYFLFDGAGTITGLTTAGKSAHALIIPETIDGVTVTAIGDDNGSLGNGAICNNYQVFSIVMPDTITYIGRYGINYCWRLKYLRLSPNAVLARNAIDWNQTTDPYQNISTIIMPSAITTLGEGVVHTKSDTNSQSNLTTIIIRTNVTSFPLEPFWVNPTAKIFTDHPTKPAGWITQVPVVAGISGAFLDEISLMTNRNAIEAAVRYQQIDELQRTIDELGEEIDTLHRDYEDEIDGLRDEISDLETERDGLIDERDELQGIHDGLKDERDELQRQYDALDDDHADLKEELKTKIKQKQDEIDAKETEIEAKQTAINGLNGEISALQGQVARVAELLDVETHEIENRLTSILAELLRLQTQTPDPEIVTVTETITVAGKPNPVLMIVGSIIAVIGLGCVGGGAAMFVLARKKRA